MQVNKQITTTQNNKHTPDKLVIIHTTFNTVNTQVNFGNYLSYKKSSYTTNLRENICGL